MNPELTSLSTHDLSKREGGGGDCAATAFAVVDVGGTKIASALAVYGPEWTGEAVAPRIEAKASRPTCAPEGGPVVMERICDAVAEALAAADEAGYVLGGIGVATAGCVDAATGSIVYASGLMPDWTGTRVADVLEERFDLPARVMGDVHAHALGEATCGAARSFASCLVVAAGTGLGGAYVNEGRVLTGARGAAGHLGHSIHPLAAGLACSCSRSSHIESVASGTGLGSLYQGVSFMDEAYDPTRDGAWVCEQAEAGDERAKAAIRDSGRALGESIGSWVNVFDPHAVILSGSVLKAGPAWRAALEEGFESQVMVPLADTPILEAELGGDAPLIGAATAIRRAVEGH